MRRRLVKLLTAPEESAAQRARRNYRQTPTAKAKQSGYWAAWYAKAENRAKAIARATKWQRDNRTHRRVYSRIWTATKRRRARELAAA